ncbi:MAG: plastocyanin/azurin family copper-binding protein [Actinomycetota bacterium]|nr:plastocyanin/azurin family copper-binding protein [Actinomycetota bacterium]
MTTRQSLHSLAAVTLLTIAACGGGNDAASDASASTDSSAPVRVVEVTMADIRFGTESLAVAAGETVEFRFTNDGEIPHDAFIGDAAAQAQHDIEMAGMDGHDHAMPGGVTVQPGATESLTYTFEDAGELEIGCHQPGHYSAGMKIDVTVG